MSDAGDRHPPLRARVEWAARAARSVMQRPSLYSVVVAYDDPTEGTYTAHCGFQQPRRRWWRPLLDVCQVRVGERPETAVVTSHGTHHRQQYRALAAIKEYPFPPKALDLSGSLVEPSQALGRGDPIPTCRIGSTRRSGPCATRVGLAWTDGIREP
jgi:hypothetical protein